MSNINLISKYEFNMGGASIEMGFTDDQQLFSKMMFVKKTTLLEQISSVTIKKAPLSSKLQYDIKTQANGKEKIFQIVQLDTADAEGIRFVNELKSKLPKTCNWNDKLEAKAVNVKDASASGVYPLEFWFMPGAKGLAGMGRGLQIAMHYGVLCLFVLPIPLFIYVLAAGCHRAITNASGIEIKKLGSSFFAWDQVDHIDVVKHLIVSTKYGTTTNEAYILDLTLHTKNGSKKKFMIRSLEGKQFIKEMIERKKMNADLATMFI